MAASCSGGPGDEPGATAGVPREIAPAPVSTSAPPPTTTADTARPTEDAAARGTAAPADATPTTSTAPPAPPPEVAETTSPPGPAPSQRLIGLHIDEAPIVDMAFLDPIEEQIGPVDVVHWYQAWGGGHGGFVSEWFDRVAASGRIGLISWEPWALTGEAAQADYTATAIADGRHDDYIRAWAQSFAARSDGPWYLRPMHEMNGDWYPWSGGVAGSDPESYRRAWRHLHAIFVAEGATDVRWVWCPLVDDIAGRFEDYYPGADVVDVLCLDGYNWGSTDPAYGGWRTVDQVFGDAYRRLLALGDQPVWFGEIGSAPTGGDKAAWIADLLTSDAFSRVEAMVFFGLDKERDWRVHADPAVAAAVRANR